MVAVTFTVDGCVNNSENTFFDASYMFNALQRPSCCVTSTARTGLETNLRAARLHGLSRYYVSAVLSRVAPSES